MAKTKTKSKSRNKKDSAKPLKDALKGGLTGLGTKEAMDLVLDLTPVPEAIQAPVTIAAAVGGGYWGGKKYGAIAGGAAAAAIEAIRFLAGAGNGSGFGGQANL